MSTNSPPDQTPVQWLYDRLAHFESAGLSRPENCSLGDYLSFLAEQHLLKPTTAEKLTTIYHQSRFGCNVAQTEPSDEVFGDLDEALNRLREEESSWVTERAELLHSKFIKGDLSAVSPHVPRSALEGLPLASNEPNYFPEELVEPQPTTESPPTQRVSSLRRPFLFTAALLVWTVTILLTTYLGHDQIRGTMVKVGLINSSEAKRAEIWERWPKLREKVRDDILHDKRADVISDSFFLIERHHQQREYAEIYYLLERLIARNPDKPHLKNNLAWTMLEVDQEWYRDSLRAKELAEEAVAAKREPAFLDTLAEACYQTGDFSRAISLEEEALSMKPSKYGSLPAEIKIHFENQLEKFRRAAEADKAKPAVAN